MELVVLADIRPEAGPAVTWLAVDDGRVAALGAGPPPPAARTLDLHGAVVLPGFIDMHAHPAEGGRESMMLDLSNVTLLEELVTRVAIYADGNPDEPWIEGAGWDAAALDGLAPLPFLDRVTSRPVFLSSSDGHSAFVNSAALRAAHLDPTRDPEGGRIDRGPDGPTGWIRETAVDRVAAVIPAWDPERTDVATARGLVGFAEHGVTTILDANADADSLASYRRLEDEGGLTARIFAAVEVDPGEIAAGLARTRRLARRFASEHVTVTGPKLYLDGVVESETASLLRPYVDGTNEPLAFSDHELDRLIAGAERAGLQVHTHAIGDAAVRQLLDAYARFEAYGRRPARPPLASHLELIDPADVPRFATLGVAADIQALWAFPDRFVRELTVPVLGPERSARLYPFAELDRAGAILVAGSDWSVTAMDPWPAIEVALTRRDPAVPGDPLAPDQALSLDRMIAAYTASAGAALPTDLCLGVLAPGCAADFVVLDRDPWRIPPEELSDVRVRETWLQGRRVYADRVTRDSSPAPAPPPAP